MLQLDYGRKAVWYRRVSGQTQADNFSFRTQDRRVKEYCKSKGLIIVKEFSDVGSGLTATGRRGFTGMCDYAFDNPDGVTDVVFTDLDRFTRNVAHFLEVTERMVKAGIHLHIALDAEEYDYHSAEKWLDRVVTAQKESRRISARTKGGQRTATELGHHIGPPPWGYMLEHETDEMDENGHHVICGKLVPDPDMWDYVIEFWDRAVKYGYTPLRLSQHMRAMGAPPPDGAWTDDSARRLMKNPKFKGTLFRGLRPQSRLPGPLENAPPIILDHSHVAAVSPEDWQAVNDAIASRDRSKGSPRSHSSPNPLSGRMKCGNCATRGVDSNLHVHRSGGRGALRCPLKKKMGADVCEFKGAILNTLLAAITDRIIHHFLTPENLQTVIDGVNEISRSMLGKSQSTLARIGERKRVITNEINNISDVLRTAGTQANDLRTLLNNLAALEKERADLESQGAQISDATEEAFLFVNDPAGIIETAMDHKTWVDPKDPEAIRELFKVFIQKVVVFELEDGATDQRVDIYYALPAFKASGQDGSNTETIRIGKKKSVGASANDCVLGTFTGIDPALSRFPFTLLTDGFPRTRGDRPTSRSCRCAALGGFPRTRGDRPATCRIAPVFRTVPPHARG